MNKEDIKVGDIVKAIFVKYGKHLVCGEVFEVSTDEHALPGTWVSIKVSGGDMNDWQAKIMVKEHIRMKFYRTCSVTVSTMNAVRLLLVRNGAS